MRRAKCDRVICLHLSIQFYLYRRRTKKYSSILFHRPKLTFSPIICHLYGYKIFIRRLYLTDDIVKNEYFFLLVRYRLCFLHMAFKDNVNSLLCLWTDIDVSKTISQREFVSLLLLLLLERIHHSSSIFFDIQQLLLLLSKEPFLRKKSSVFSTLLGLCNTIEPE